jgi:hypothetical protein
MVLNLKSFQSFNQKPYCKAHLPKVTGAGVGADSAELKRLRNVSNMVSNVQYKQHAAHMNDTQQQSHYVPEAQPTVSHQRQTQASAPVQPVVVAQPVVQQQQQDYSQLGTVPA